MGSLKTAIYTVCSVDRLQSYLTQVNYMYLHCPHTIIDNNIKIEYTEQNTGYDSGLMDLVM